MNPAGSPRPSALRARLRHRVHDRLAIDVDLRLVAGCGVVFGASGAGKSTLLRLIAGLERPGAGLVELDGETVFDADSGVDRPLRDRRIGMVFQDDLLFPHLGVRRNIAFGLSGRPAAEVRDRVAEVATLCGVAHLLDRYPQALSGGERQRVGLARALAPRPRLLLCDEPVSALDLPSRNALVDRLREVIGAERIPVLYVTHSPAEAVALGSTLFLLDGGRIVAEGPPIDVLATTATGEGALSGVANTFAATVEGGSVAAGSTAIRLDGGPVLIVPRLADPSGTRVNVSVLADEILLARGPIDGLSARNILPGVVERVLVHAAEAEVFVRTGSLTWVVSVVAPTLEAMAIRPGLAVSLVLKARSCRVTPAGRSPGRRGGVVPLGE